MVDKPIRGNNILELVCISDPSCIAKLEVEESFASERSQKYKGTTKMSSCSNNITIQKNVLVLKS